MLLALAALTLAGGALAGCAPASLVVDTDYGVVRGFHAANGARVFKGIPFVAPPVGALRFAAPEPPAPWAGVLDANATAPSCVQNPLEELLPGFPRALVAGQSEDCMYLEIFTPGAARGRGRGRVPVMVYFHDGGFATGTSTFLKSETLAQKNNVIVVHAPYRLNVFGAFTLPGDETEGSNLWFRDQEAALAWVQDNIEAFGGNPDKVTIAGTSAGGLATIHHLVAQSGMFTRAIAMSFGGGATHVGAVQANAANLAALFNCSGGGNAAVLACMRAVPAAELEAAARLNGLVFTAHYGAGTQFPVPVQDAVAAGDFDTGVKIMTGVARSEGNVYAAGLPRLIFGSPQVWAVDDPAYPQQYFLTSTFVLFVLNFGYTPAAAEEIVAFYEPIGAQRGYGVALAQMIHEGLFVCNNMMLMRNAAAHGAKVYSYEFAHAPVDPIYPGLNATHTSDMAFVFGSASSSPIPNHVGGVFTPAEVLLSEYMQRQLASFMKRGRPAPGRGCRWRRFTARSQTQAVFSLESLGGTQVAPIAVPDSCAAVWDKYIVAA